MTTLLSNGYGEKDVVDLWRPDFMSNINWPIRSSVTNYIGTI